MADRTLTINHADGGSETYTINRDKFAGVREMSRGHVYPTIAATNFNLTGVVFTKSDEKTFTLVASNSTETRYATFINHSNGIRTGKHRMEFDLVLNSGSISSGFDWNYTDNDDDPNTGSGYAVDARPTVGHNSFEFEIFNDGMAPNPHAFFRITAGSTFDISVTNFKVTHEPDTVTVDHTAKPKAQSKETTFGGSKSITIKRDIEPLLSKVVGGASAAYSLRDLNDKANTSKVVRVRRESDNNERDFTAKEVSNGTLLDWVNADIDKLDLQPGSLDPFITNETATGFDFSLNNEGSVGQKRLLSVPNTTVGTYNATFDVVVNSGSLSGITLTRIGNDNQIVAGSNSINLTVTPSTLGGAIFFRTNSTAGADVSITNITLTQTTADGFVETWYDQSGNGNDASQLTAGNQPKIVDAGVLVTDRDGKGALNGKGANLDLPNDAPMLSADGTYSVFAVVDFDDQRNGNDVFNNILRFSSKTNGGASSTRKPLIYLAQSDGQLASTDPSYTQGTARYTLADTLSVQLLTDIANPAFSIANHTLYADGALVSSSNTATSVNTETLLGSYSQIFDSNETTVTHFLSEVIYYPSDQSANRLAIEANINNQYDIY